MSPRALPPLIGRYKVVDRLSHGGMGDVYRARDPKLGGRMVAIKVPRVADEGLLERMLQEAAIAGSLIHPNIVTIYDSGEHDGLPFIVMEFVEGVTLDSHIRNGTQFTLLRKLELVEQLADGLEYAHTFRAEGIAGIVHRDIKPANLILDRKGTLRILDFGIARLADSRMTLEPSAIGTPNYMSPEQVRGSAIDRRSDIFSAGLVIYELLAYRKAFAGDNYYAVITAVEREMPPPLGTVVPDLDPQLENIVTRAIQKDPARRYQSMAELARDIVRVRERLRADLPDEADDRTVILSREGALPTPHPPTTPRPSTPSRPSTNRSGSQSHPFSERRHRAIEQHLERAKTLYDAGNFAGSLDACEEAAVIDPEEPRVLEWLERCRTALDAERVRAWVAEAQSSFEQHDFDNASQLVDRALELAPSQTEARTLRAAIDHERAKRGACAAAVMRARAQHAAGQFESAIRSASEALLHDPTNLDAQEISRAAVEAINVQRLREAEEQAALRTVEEQRRLFAAGRRREAIAALEALAPTHTVITVALRELQSELSRLTTWAAGVRERARLALDEGRFSEAIDTLRQVDATFPGDPDVAALLTRAVNGRDEAEARARREAEIATTLRAARNALSAGALEDAGRLVEGLLSADPRRTEALALRDELAAAVTARKRDAALEAAATAAVADAQREFEAGRHREAVAALEAFTPSHAIVVRARTELKSRLAVIEREESNRKRLTAANELLDQAEAHLLSGDTVGAVNALNQADSLQPGMPRSQQVRARLLERLETERRRAEFDAHATETVVEARQRFAAGDERAALHLLERFAPSHPLVTEALSTIRLEIEQRQAKTRDEEAARRRKEAEDQAQAKQALEEKRLRDEEAAERAAAERRAQVARRLSDGVARAQQAASAIEGVAILQRLLADAGGGDGFVQSNTLPPHLAALAEAKAAADLLLVLRADLVSSLERLLTDEDSTRALQVLSEIRDRDAWSPVFDRLHEAARAQNDARVAAARKQSARGYAPDRVRPGIDSSATTGENPQSEITAREEPRPTLDRIPGSPERSRVPLWGGAALATVVALGGASAWYFLSTSPAEPGRNVSVNTTALTSIPAPAPTTIPVAGTSIPPSSVVTTSIQPQAERGDIDTYSSGSRLLASGDLAGAVEIVARGLGRAPGNADLQRLMRDILAAAARRANEARRGADVAGGSTRQEYQQALLRLNSAEALRQRSRSDQAPQTVDVYLDAARLFTSAGRQLASIQPTVFSSTPTTIPVVVTTIPPASSVASTVPSTTPTTVPVAPAGIDRTTVDAILAAYSRAYSTLDVAELSKIQQNISPASRTRLEVLKKNFSRCDLTFRNVSIVPGNSGTEATVRADGVEACRGKIGVSPPENSSRYQFVFVRSGNAPWRLSEVFTSQ